MRQFVLVALGLLVSSTVLVAQQPVTAFQIHQACRHPAAFPVDSFPSTGDVISHGWQNWEGHPARDPALSLLCTEVNVRTPGMSWQQTVARFADVAAQGSFPRAGEIRFYAEHAESARYDWITRRRESGVAIRERMHLPAAHFQTGSPEVTLPDTTLRRMAEALQEHLRRYPSDTVAIQGQADHRGDYEANQRLANQRAVNLYTALLQFDDGTLSANKERLFTVGIVKDSVTTPVQQAQVIVGRSRDRAGLREGELAEDRESALFLVSASAVSDTRLISVDRPEARPPEVASPTRGSLAVAVVDVIGAQAAEQIQLYLAEEVVRGVCDGSDGGGHHQRLLPNTCALFGDERTRRVYRPTIAALRSSVRQDVQIMMPKLVVLAVAESLDSSNAQGRADAVYAVALAQYVTSVVNGEHALVAFAELPDRLRELLPNSTSSLNATHIGRVLQTVGPFVELYSGARATIRGGVDASALHDQVLALAVRAFLVNSSDPLVWGVADEAAIRSNVQQVLRTVPAVVDAVNRLEHAYAAFHNRLDVEGDQRIALVRDIVNASLDLFLATLPTDPIQQDRYQAFARGARDLSVALAGRDYRDALLRGLVLVSTATHPDRQECGMGSGLACPVAGMFSESNLRLAMFAFDLAEAQDQDGMNAALRNFVGQGGGYRTKRQGEKRSFFTVNAYLGGTGGREIGYGDNSGRSTQLGFYLPVGVEWVRRCGDGCRLPAFSVFLQVVDLGSFAAARYRLKESGSGVPAEPELLDVLSPGIYAVAPLGELPLSFGLGVSVVPRALQLEDEESNQPRVVGAVRWSAFLAVDVPLFP